MFRKVKLSLEQSTTPCISEPDGGEWSASQLAALLLREEPLTTNGWKAGWNLK